MKKLVFSFLLLTSFSSSAQLNTGYLIEMLKTSGEYRVTDTIDYMLEKFVRFENFNSTKKYDVYFDSSGKLARDINLSIVYREFDLRGREVKNIGYDIDGSS